VPSDSERLGIIAGGGKFPLMAAASAKKLGLHVVAAAHQGDTDPSLADLVDKIEWVKLGQLGKIINLFKKEGVRKVLMAGSISKSNMFGRTMPDLKGIAFISRMAILHDDGILRALADEFAKEGIDIISSTEYLPELLAPKGCLTKKRPDKEQEEDIRIGWDVAKELGRLDVGQCIVIKKRTVLALEAIDGTNATIARGGKIAGKGAVVIKVSKPNQDMRFDVPSVGRETIENMAGVNASVLAVEAGKTLLFDKNEMIESADKAGIAIVCY
jgi:UDP-2,3-diacylglucosamine hydrolase